MRLIVGILLALLVASGGVATAGTYRDHMAKMLASESAMVRFRPDLESVVLRSVNAYRASKGLAALRPAGSLQAAARAQAMDLALNSMMGHKSSTGMGFDSRMRAIKDGALFPPSMGENAARERSSGAASSAKAQRLVKQWIDSGSHRRTMSSRSYVAVATGVVQKGDQLYAVQIFTGPEVKTNASRAGSGSGVY